MREQQISRREQKIHWSFPKPKGGGGSIVLQAGSVGLVISTLLKHWVIFGCYGRFRAGNLLKEFDLSFVGGAVEIVFCFQNPSVGIPCRSSTLNDNPQWHQVSDEEVCALSIPHQLTTINIAVYDPVGRFRCLESHGFFLHSSKLDDDVYIVSWVKRGWKLGAEGPRFVCIPFSLSHRMSKDSFFNWCFLPSLLGKVKLTLIVFSFILS